MRRCAGVSVTSANAFRGFRGKRYDSRGSYLRFTATTRRTDTSAMASKPKPSPDTATRGRIATTMDQPDSQASVSSSNFVRAPSYSPAELAGFRDFAKVMRDAIGEKGSFNELKPGEAAERGCLGTLKSLHRHGLVTFDKELCEFAAYGGQLKVLQWLLENGCPVDEAVDDDSTPLYLAAQNGHGAVVRALIQAGADINKADDDGATPLFMAAQQGHEAVVRALIKAGADVDKEMNDGAPPLRMAAKNDHKAVVRELIKAGADVEKANYDGWTPLFIATQKGYLAVVRCCGSCSRRARTSTRQ